MTQESKTPIKYKVVDSREHPDIRTKLLEMGWIQQELFSADFWFFDIDYKKVGIERKEVGDFLNSIGDRLTNQLERMLDHYDTTILLLEGNWRQVTASNNIISGNGINHNTWAMCWNYIRSQQHKGVSIELTMSVGHTIQRVNELYAWYQSSSHTGGMSHRTFIDDRVMAFPKGCRGKTAESVLSVFKSLVAVGNAEVSDLMHVDGIGQKKAQNIYDHFNNFRGEMPEMKQEEVVIEKDSAIEQGKLL